MLARLPSLSTIIFVIFLSYISYSLWSMIQLFIPPSCANTQKCLRPLIEDKPKFQLVAFASTKRTPVQETDLSLIHKEVLFDYLSDWQTDVRVNIPRSVRSNGSMHLHLFLTTQNVQPKWKIIANEPLSVYATVPLTKYSVPRAKTFNLLGEENKEDSQDTKASQSIKAEPSLKPVTHFSNVIAFNLLTDEVLLPRDQVPYEIGRNMRLSRNGKYLPVLHIDLMQITMKDLTQVNETTHVLNLTMKYTPISYGKLRMWVQFEEAMESMLRLGFTHKDIDEVKGIFSDTNLYLLCVTFVVASLHLAFDFLAFKNDIAFWRGLDSMRGISPSTVIWNAFAQAIVFLFLLEEKTSMLVLVPTGAGVIIELWKVTKAFHAEFSGWRPRISHALTKEEDVTHKLDNEGVHYLSYIMFPLVLGGAVYSLLYVSHKSWYSWLIHSTANGVYAFGFLFMLPQIFINYKLKSIAHLSWKALMYKAFNTFIDDLFAFIITMPTAHRVACFRDDIVFIIYVYQRWLYPVDKSRMNEFGQSGEKEIDKKKKNE